MISSIRSIATDSSTSLRLFAVAPAVPSSRLIAPGLGSPNRRPSAGQPTVDLGHERRRLLMTDQHVPDRRASQRVGEADVPPRLWDSW